MTYHQKQFLFISLFFILQNMQRFEWNCDDVKPDQLLQQYDNNLHDGIFSFSNWNKQWYYNFCIQCVDCVMSNIFLGLDWRKVIVDGKYIAIFIYVFYNKPLLHFRAQALWTVFTDVIGIEVHWNFKSIYPLSFNVVRNRINWPFQSSQQFPMIHSPK